MAMITSATGSTALLMTGLVAMGEARGPGLGVQYLMVAGLVTGLLQMAWGYLRLAIRCALCPKGFERVRQRPGAVDSPSCRSYLICTTAMVLPASPWGPDPHRLGPGVVAGDHLRLAPTDPGGSLSLVAIVVLTLISVGFSFEIPTVSSLGRRPPDCPASAFLR